MPSVDDAIRGLCQPWGMPASSDPSGRKKNKVAGRTEQREFRRLATLHELAPFGPVDIRQNVTDTVIHAAVELFVAEFPVLTNSTTGNKPSIKTKRN